MRRGGDNEQAETEFEETCDILVLGIGSLCRWKWPDIEGLWDFKGPIAHTADYNIDDKDLEGKRIGVIGNVSSYQRGLIGQIMNS